MFLPFSLFFGASFLPSGASKNRSVWRQPSGSSSGAPTPPVLTNLPQLPCPCLLLTFLQTDPGGLPTHRENGYSKQTPYPSLPLPPLPIFGTGTHISFSSNFPAISARQGCLPIPREECLITVSLPPAHVPLPPAQPGAGAYIHPALLGLAPRAYKQRLHPGEGVRGPPPPLATCTSGQQGEVTHSSRTSSFLPSHPALLAQSPEQGLWSVLGPGKQEAQSFTTRRYPPSKQPSTFSEHKALGKYPEESLVLEEALQTQHRSSSQIHPLWLCGIGSLP